MMKQKLGLFAMMLCSVQLAFTQFVHSQLDSAITLNHIGELELDFNHDNLGELTVWFDTFNLGAGCDDVQKYGLFTMITNDTLNYYA
jgi:hypothetical protein